MAHCTTRTTRRPRGCGRRPHAAAPIAAALLTAGLVLVAAPDCADGGEPAPPGLPPGRMVENLDETAVPSLLSFVRELKAAATKGPQALTEAVREPMLSGTREGASVKVGVDISYTQELSGGAAVVDHVRVGSSSNRRVDVGYAPSRGGVVSNFNGEFVHDGHLYSCLATFEQDGTFKSALYFPWGSMEGTKGVGTVVSRTDDGRYRLIEDFKFDVKNVRFATEPPGEETPKGGAPAQLQLPR